MIFLCGIPSEPSLGLVIEKLTELGAPHVVFNQRRVAETDIEFEIQDSRVFGRLQIGECSYHLEDFTAVYTRLMDHRVLPEIENEPPGSAKRLHAQSLHAAVMQWYDLAPGRILNRSRQNGLSYSKPFQSQIIRKHGFAIPETLVTNDPDRARQFHERHGRTIYKSASYVRSIVRFLDDDDLRRLDHIRICPVQFQEYIEGRDVRVHTIGDKVFATAITAAAVDYRYAYKEGETETVEATTLSDELVERCLGLASTFGLEFAGIDLKINGAGEVYCLEVNPSPAFSYFELKTGQPISRAVAEHLAADG